MKLDESFFKNAGLPAWEYSAVDGKYIKLTSTSDLASFAQLCNPSTLAGCLRQGGHRLRQSQDGDGQRPARDRVQAAEEPVQRHRQRIGIGHPQILRIAGPANEGTIDFSDYNASATITAPPASQVIDGSKFGL